MILKLLIEFNEGLGSDLTQGHTHTDAVVKARSSPGFFGKVVPRDERLFDYIWRKAKLPRQAQRLSELMFLALQVLSQRFVPL